MCFQHQHGIYRILFILTGFVCMLNTIGYASEISAYNKHHIALSSDNDVYFEPTNYDRYYTAGHNLSYTSKEWQNSPLQSLALFSRLFKKDLASSFSIGLGQEIYTPAARFAVHPPADDAPYAGYLYLNTMIQNRTSNFLEQLELNIGMVGKAALGKEAQDLIHTLVHYYPLAGWDHQIKNEFILNAYYKAMYRVDIVPNIFDILPYGVIALGNANTHLELGAKMRIGYGLHGDFGIQKATSNHIGTTSLNDNPRFYVMLGIAERFIGRNIFIQGNSFGGFQTELDMARLMYEAEIGALIAWKGISLAYVYSYKQKEFSTQLLDSNYATLRLEISF
ncbi:lipid A deacylase LpxR family protein [Helicobacter trogontum]|uniref:Lipid A deacylase LpxR family protein n=1 Tax=Helicobacter trogontum TaxID=50960 RepID=A0A4U8TDB1_9HELI|nr:lipid A deacylase LpxR family protein [Helicobacter trogontum]MCI5786809.1 lipid A deacylase LpxR family protein [Helicobacter trogontum]MDY5184298.1 lipid A deacylase LpxR family protein [Helicobacter trogontum]TLD97991.1 lipid A deacylase LpxR family protein [Helicobacter trogontum]SFZ72651.1 OMP15 [Helicobacter trogontum]